MKIVGFIAALALATAPMLATAQQTNSDDDDDESIAAVEPGGVSQSGTLPAFDDSSIPAGAIIVGGVVVLGGILIGVIASGNSNSTVSTN